MLLNVVMANGSRVKGQGCGVGCYCDKLDMLRYNIFVTYLALHMNDLTLVD